jgi:bacterioferritin-associated ferredoxin
MFVCVCRAVPDTAIRSVIREGASTVEEVADRCGAGSSCGACRPVVLRMLADNDAPEACTEACSDCPHRLTPVYSRAS